LLRQLSRFGFSWRLFSDFPVHKRVVVRTSGALPGAFRGIGVTVMSHFNDEVAMQTHRGFAIDEFGL
jgi:hypothetical protein